MGILEKRKSIEFIIISLVILFFSLLSMILQLSKESEIVLKNQISQSPSCESDLLNISTASQISCILDKRISESDQKEAVRSFLQNQRNILSLWNYGEDYTPTLQAQIDNLPQEGGEIIIPAGRYKIKTPINITKNNIIIKASSFGEVILESQNITGYMFDIRGSYVILENLTLWGDKEIGVYAVTFSNAHNRIVSSIIIDFDFGFLLDTWAYNTTVYGNYLFDNGYYTIRVTGWNLIGEGCQVDAHDILLENNFLSGNNQGIDLFCSSNITIRNNTIRDSNISGLRVERSDYNTIEQNMFYQNRLHGMWVYGFSDHNVFRENIIIDNNKENMPFWFDCWTPQGSIYNDYIYNRPGAIGYPYLRQENGDYIFTNFFCQFQGDEIELRNNVKSNLFYNNIIGRYSVLKDNLGWQSINDLRMSFFPTYSNVNRSFLSNNNNFTQNYFLNSGSERIMDQGCDNLYTLNKLVTFDTPSIQDFTPVLNDTYQFHCRGEPICNSNGICESVRGEQYINCASDCSLINLGQNGSRQKRDVCAQGLMMTEAIFPANPGCINIYDGSYKCTDSDNGIFEPQYGENYCNLPDTDRDGMPDEWEIQYNLNISYANDSSLDPDADGRSNLQEFKDGTNPLIPDTPTEPPGGEHRNDNRNGGVVPPIMPQCNDKKDNDADGKIDYPNDPGCLSRNDNSEIDTVLINGTCTENWECTSYGLCLKGIQVRSCEDTNNCNTFTRKPSIEQVCTDEDSSSNDDNENSSTLKIISLIILPVLTLAVIVAVIFTIKVRKKL